MQCLFLASISAEVGSWTQSTEMVKVLKFLYGKQSAKTYELWSGRNTDCGEQGGLQQTDIAEAKVT
jgi:hypothetical protein